MMTAHIAVNTQLGLVMRQALAPGPMTRGRQYGAINGFRSKQVLPTDSTGNVVVAFSGVKAGSEIHLIDYNMVEIAGTESASGTPEFLVPRYAAGSPGNNIRAIIVSLGYENLDIDIEIQQSNITVPVFQRVDRNYRNPI